MAGTDYVKAYGVGKKFALWFGITFAGIFLPLFADALLNFSQALDVHVFSSVVISAVLAAVTATIRLAIAQFPIFRVDNNIGKSKTT